SSKCAGSICPPRPGWMGTLQEQSRYPRRAISRRPELGRYSSSLGTARKQGHARAGGPLRTNTPHSGYYCVKKALGEEPNCLYRDVGGDVLYRLQRDKAKF